MTKHNATPQWMVELWISLAIAVAILLAWMAIAAHAEERATFTDRNGHFAGSSVTSGSTTTFFDQNGRFQGTATQQSRDQSRPLGNVNGSDPFGRRGR